MGLWLGASVLAAAQLLDYLVFRCIACCSKSGENTNRVSEINHQMDDKSQKGQSGSHPISSVA